MGTNELYQRLSPDAQKLDDYPLSGGDLPYCAPRFLSGHPCWYNPVLHRQKNATATVLAIHARPNSCSAGQKLRFS